MTPVEVSSEFWDLTRYALRWWKRSRGTFDITVAPLLKAWGFWEGTPHVPSPEDLSQAKARVGAQNLELIPSRRAVRFRMAGVELDFGGLAKGHAAERAARLAHERGAASVLVNFGGSSFCAAGDDEKPARARENQVTNEPTRSSTLTVGEWPVIIPGLGSVPKSAQYLVLPSGWSPSTSASTEQLFRGPEGRILSHIIDPRTASPIEDLCSATVLARSGLQTEVLTKHCFCSMVPCETISYDDTEDSAGRLSSARMVGRQMFGNRHTPASFSLRSVEDVASPEIRCKNGSDRNGDGQSFPDRGAGAPLKGLTPIESSMFEEGLQRAIQLESGCDDGCADVQLGSFIDPKNANFVTKTNSAGLGVRFNGDQCTVCHNQPALGGSGGFLVPNPQDPPNQYQRPENPMFRLIPHRKGAANSVPSFIEQFGPIREVRFAKKPDGTPDGGVHQLFTVVGRSDVIPPGQPNTCTAEALPPTDFETQFKNGNTRFRIPLQLFGLGILDGIQDREILERHRATEEIREAVGIHGMPNRSGNDGTITRFGWKAQNKSIAIFAGEAYNVEMGITNDLFPQAVDESPACSPDKNEPNDIFRNDPSDDRNQAFKNPLHIIPDWLMFAIFMRFLDAPQPVAFSASAQRGQQLFGTDASNPGIGCFACHTPTLVTPAKSETDALQSLTVHPYTDLLIHHMGKGLADDITQGLATGDMFRTTPLWGVGQRIFFLHDGRTNDLLKAIRAHHSAGGDCDDASHSPCYGPSEANGVIDRFNALSERDKQAILDFLRSL